MVQYCKASLTIIEHKKGCKSSINYNQAIDTFADVSLNAKK